MNPPVVLTPEAEADLDEAAQWYDQKGAGLAAELVRRVRETLARIGANPNLYAELRNGVRRAPVRRFPYGAFYRQYADRIEVFAILHERRKPSIWRRRL